VSPLTAALLDCALRRAGAHAAGGGAALGIGYDARMPTAPELLTASKIAAQLKVTDAKVKKAIAALKLAPAAKKGPCSYYAAADLAKIKKALG
jgi:hypothetical protein